VPAPCFLTPNSTQSKLMRPRAWQCDTADASRSSSRHMSDSLGKASSLGRLRTRYSLRRPPAPPPLYSLMARQQVSGESTVERLKNSENCVLTTRVKTLL
jgi:hypothetical protein